MYNGSFFYRGDAIGGKLQSGVFEIAYRFNNPEFNNPQFAEMRYDGAIFDFVLDVGSREPRTITGWYQAELYSSAVYPVPSGVKPTLVIKVEFEAVINISQESGYSYPESITYNKISVPRINGTETSDGEGTISPSTIFGSSNFAQNPTSSRPVIGPFPDDWMGTEYLCIIRYPQNDFYNVSRGSFVRTVPEREVFSAFDIAGNQISGHCDFLSGGSMVANRIVTNISSQLSFGKPISSIGIISFPDSSWSLFYKDWRENKCKIMRAKRDQEVRSLEDFEEAMTIFSEPKIKSFFVIRLQSNQLAAVGVKIDWGGPYETFYKTTILFKRQDEEGEWPSDEDAVEVDSSENFYVGSAAILIEMPTGELRILSGYDRWNSKNFGYKSLNGGEDWGEF